MSQHERALAAVLKRQGRTLSPFEREQVLYLAAALAAAGPPSLACDAWDRGPLLLALETAGYVVVAEPGDHHATTLHLMVCGGDGTWLLTHAYDDGCPTLQVQRLAGDPPGTVPAAFTPGSWLQALLRFLYTDLPAIVRTERDWGTGAGPDSLLDVADAVLAQNDADVSDAARTANRQAARLLYALEALLAGQDPVAHLVTAEEAREAADFAARAPDEAW